MTLWSGSTTALVSGSTHPLSFGSELTEFLQKLESVLIILPQVSNTDHHLL